MKESIELLPMMIGSSYNRNTPVKTILEKYGTKVIDLV